MLILTNDPGHSVFITNKTTGEEIRIVNVGTKGSKQRIGFDAPQNYSIQRDNCSNRKEKNREQQD